LNPEDVQATFVATLVDEWIRRGVRHAVVCPGSRSTPLALALADRDEIDIQVHHDERSGAFVALGIGAATGVPAVVVTTSGTAAVELHPAVVEAHEASVPMLVCTADRPPELQGVGAPQTVDQTRLFGAATRWFADPGVPEECAAGTWRTLALRALVAATGPRPGPAHLNLRFGEPLVGLVGLLAEAAPRDVAGRSDAVAARGEPSVALVDELMGYLVGRRGVIVAGVGSSGATTVLAELLGWPVVPPARAAAAARGRRGGPAAGRTARSRCRSPAEAAAKNWVSLGFAPGQPPSM
jgi:2-succinyl-5-enolpyruvyl-6-hydroxy-3-cyclohexene-1-carboxylate synthase